MVAASETAPAGITGGEALPDAGVSLARANLLRVRGQWTEAADLCVAVLRADPGNATAHSLLGDIYQDQGRPEEAKHWYQLALELCPASVADRAKLERVRETLEARSQRAEWEAVIEGRTQPVATAVLVRESLQRVGAVAGAGVCGIILVMATLVSLQEPGRNQDSGTPSLLFPSRPSRSGPVLDTQREQLLFRRLREYEVSGPGRLGRLELDPRDNSATARILLPASLRDRYNTADYRRQALREGYRWAHHLFRVDPNVSRVDLFVVGSPGAQGGPPSEVVAASLAPPLSARPDDARTEEIERAFAQGGGIKWGPEFQPTSGEPGGPSL